VADETLRAARELVRLRRVLADPSAKHTDLLVINRSGERRPGYIPRDEFARAVEMEPLAVIPFHRRRIARLGPDSILSGNTRGAVERLAAEISGRHVTRSWWRRLLPWWSR
jgi:hypothetical protein